MAEDVFELLRKRREAEARGEVRIVQDGYSRIAEIAKRRKRNQQKRWEAEHKEEIAERHRKFLEEHPEARERIREYDRKYRAEHHDEILERRRERENTPEYKAKEHEYYLKNRDAILERHRRNKARRMAENPERERAISRESKRREYARNRDAICARAREKYANMSEEKRAIAKQKMSDRWKAMTPEQRKAYYARRKELREMKKQQSTEAA